MVLDIEPVDAAFGATVRGTKLNALEEPTWRALYDAWLEYALLIFPAQNLTRAEQIALARRFGSLEAEMLKVSNVKPDGTLYAADKDEEYLRLLAATYHWHSDSSYKPIHAKGSVFCAEVVPSNGTQTGWADMRAAYDFLSPELRAMVEPLRAYHSFYQSHLKHGHCISEATEAAVRADGANFYGPMEGASPALRPLVKVHPETGRKSLLIGHHVCGIEGLAESEAESLVNELMDFACQPPRTYHHDWKPGDAVIWDNRCLLHRARPYAMNVPRVMWHSRIAGDPVSEAALG